MTKPKPRKIRKPKPISNMVMSADLFNKKYLKVDLMCLLSPRDAERLALWLKRAAIWLKQNKNEYRR